MAFYFLMYLRKLGGPIFALGGLCLMLLLQCQKLHWDLRSFEVLCYILFMDEFNCFKRGLNTTVLGDYFVFILPLDLKYS